MRRRELRERRKGKMENCRKGGPQGEGPGLSLELRKLVCVTRNRLVRPVFTTKEGMTEPEITQHCTGQGSEHFKEGEVATVSSATWRSS